MAKSRTVHASDLLTSLDLVEGSLQDAAAAHRQGDLRGDLATLRALHRVVARVARESAHMSVLLFGSVEHAERELEIERLQNGEG